MDRQEAEIESTEASTEASGGLRDWIWFGVLWLVLSVIFWAVYAAIDVFPEAYAREARVVDDAFSLLVYLGIPVFAFVLAVLVYALFRFRSSDRDEDGPPLTGRPRTVWIWLIITSALALLLIINPGFVGLAEIRGEPDADLVIDIEAQRWYWTVTYPNGEQTQSIDSDLVIPVNRRVRFAVTAPETDIVHSFWIPAFRIKIDAVPGRSTELLVTPEKTGSYEDDPGLRVQCAELCGVGHAEMAMGVRVVEAFEFEQYLASLREE